MDASVIVKWYIEEDMSNKARIIQEEYIKGSYEIHCPDLLYYEVVNALLFSKIYDGEELKAIGDSLINYNFQTHDSTKSVLQKALQIATSTDSALYDSYYLALALDLQAKLITADSKFYNSVVPKISTENLVLLQSDN